MARGQGLLSGSSTVVYQITDDGAVIFGRDMPVVAQLSGTLTLRLAGTQGANRWMRSGVNGEATWSALTSSLVGTTPLGNLTSSNVQDALNELQDSINQLSVGAGSYVFSDGVNNESVDADGSTLIWTGSANQTEVTYNPAANRYTIGLGRNITHTGSLTVTGQTSLQSLAVTTLSASQNVFVEDQLVVSGNTTLGPSGSAFNTILMNGKLRLPIFTIASVPSEYSATPNLFPGYAFYLQGAGAPGQFEQSDKFYFNERGIWFPSMFFSGS